VVRSPIPGLGVVMSAAGVDVIAAKGTEVFYPRRGRLQGEKKSIEGN